jgi:hypothetical protein
MGATAFLISMEVDLHKFIHLMVGTTKNGGLNKLEMAGSLLEAIVQVMFSIQIMMVTFTLIPTIKATINTGYFRKSMIDNIMLKIEKLEDICPKHFGVMILRQIHQLRQVGLLMIAFGDSHQYDIKSDNL